MRFSHWVSLVILGVCLYVLWLIRNVLLLALTAIVGVVVLNRAVRSLQHYIPDRRLAVLGVMGTILLGLGIVGLAVIPTFVDQIQDLANLVPAIFSRLNQRAAMLENWLPDLFADDNFPGLVDIFNQLQALDLELIFEHFFSLFSNTLEIAFNGLIVIVLMIMLLLNPAPYRQLFLRIFPASSRQQVSQVLDNCEVAISSWFLGALFTMAVITPISLVTLLILGIPLALANSLLAGLLVFIPNLGPVMSVVPPVAIALLDAPWKAIAVVVLYILMYQLERNLLTPLVVQRQFALLPAVTLVAQIIFAAFFGFLGLLLALPLTLILQQWLKKFWVNDVLEQH
ncbi:MAG: AI-2E family transporter [Nodosilinea sp.]